MMEEFMETLVIAELVSVEEVSADPVISYLVNLMAASSLQAKMRTFPFCSLSLV